MLMRRPATRTRKKQRLSIAPTPTGVEVAVEKRFDSVRTDELKESDMRSDARCCASFAPVAAGAGHARALDVLFLLAT